MFSAGSRAILPDPPDELKHLSSGLADRVRQRIHEGGPMPFPAFMDMALYEPGLGYYSAGLHKFGEGGDFVTAPELGGLFARCLANQALEIGDELGDWEVLEIGAGSGRLAADFLAALPAERAPRRYRILERSADLKREQRRRIRESSTPPGCEVEWLERPPAEDWQGMLLANEVIDALSVERFALTAEGIQQLAVDVTDGGFGWIGLPAPAGLREAVTGALAGLASPPPGYRSEICLQLPAWLQGLTAHLRRGIALFVDYGYPRCEYYSPERTDGTLVCHYRHRAHGDPFTWPGLQDISAFVDFTAVAEAAVRCGLEVAGYTSQAMFLLGCGLADVDDELAEMPDRERMAASQEIRMLTLPGQMGEKFQCMALARDFDRPLRGFSWQDLRHRL